MSESMKEITSKLPTNDELRAIIEKIAEFLTDFLKLFDALKAGLAETFSKYESAFETTTAAATEEVE
ncbi:MAG: hypothetical protein IJK89_04300 [Clostridia bacterium]|nr:hypothetical protein [Clostridia bacterium]